MAATKKLEIDQGATFPLGLTIKDADLVAIDISAWTFRGQIREFPESSTTLASFSFDITDGPNGQVTASLSAAVTAAIPVPDSKSSSRRVAKYAYDIEAVRADGSVIRLLEGIAEVSPEVTK